MEGGASGDRRPGRELTQEGAVEGAELGARSGHSIGAENLRMLSHGEENISDV